MRFEHFALNVPDARAMAAWYVTSCAMRIVRGSEEPPYGHFLADGAGHVVLELYSNPQAPMPEYPSEDPRRFHFAFAVEDAAAVRDTLVAAGARLVHEDEPGPGTRLVMLRDPWGVPLQICQRGEPLG